MAYVGQIVAGADGKPQIVESTNGNMTITRPARSDELVNRSLPANISPQYNPNSTSYNKPAEPARTVDVLQSKTTSEDVASMLELGYMPEHNEKGEVVKTVKDGVTYQRYVYTSPEAGTYKTDTGNVVIKTEPNKTIIKGGAPVATFQGNSSYEYTSTREAVPSNEGKLPSQQVGYKETDSTSALNTVTIPIHTVQSPQHGGYVTESYAAGEAPAPKEPTLYENAATFATDTALGFGASFPLTPMPYLLAAQYYGMTNEGRGKVVDYAYSFTKSPVVTVANIAKNEVALPIGENVRGALKGKAFDIGVLLGLGGGLVAGHYLGKKTEATAIDEAAAKKGKVTVDITKPKYVYDAEVLDYKVVVNKAGMMKNADGTYTASAHLKPFKDVTHIERIESDTPLSPTNVYDLRATQVTKVEPRGTVETAAPKPIVSVRQFDIRPKGITDLSTGKTFRSPKIEMVPPPERIYAHGYSFESIKAKTSTFVSSAVEVVKSYQPDFIGRLRYTDKFYTESAKGFVEGSKELAPNFWRAKQVTIYQPIEPIKPTSATKPFISKTPAKSIQNFDFLKDTGKSAKPLDASEPKPSGAKAPRGSANAVVENAMNTEVPKAKHMKPIIGLQQVDVKPVTAPVAKVSPKFYDGSIFQDMTQGGEILAARKSVNDNALKFNSAIGLDVGTKGRHEERQLMNFKVSQRFDIKRNMDNDISMRQKSGQDNIMPIMNAQAMNLKQNNPQAIKQERAQRNDYKYNFPIRNFGGFKPVRSGERVNFDVKPPVPHNNEFRFDVMRQPARVPASESWRYLERRLGIESPKKVLKRL